MITHIFREGNKYLDKRVNLGIDSLVKFFWLFNLPLTCFYFFIF